MNNFKLGFSKNKITPPVGVRLYGYPGARLSHAIADDLFVNTLAFSDNNHSALLISVDICALPAVYNLALRELISKETGVDANNIILAAIHTHSGPSTAENTNSGSNGWGGPNMDFIENILFPQTVLSAKEALSSLRSATMGIGETESLVGVNRRELDENGNVILGQNPDGPLDKRMRVLSFKATDGTPIVNVIHYGCHPTAAGPAPEISRDWPGFMTDKLEKFSGVPSVFFNGAEGDIGPRLKNGMTIADMEEAKALGLIAGDDAIKAFQNIKSYSIPEFSVKSGELCLPYSPLPTLEEAKDAMEALGDPDKLIETDVLLYSRYKKIIDHYKNNLPMQEAMRFTQTYIALGSVVFVPYPMEIFCEISLNQQKNSPFLHTLCLSNANGSIGYLPTEAQIPYGGYEIESFTAKNVFVLKTDTDKRIVEENAKLLKELF